MARGNEPARPQPRMRGCQRPMAIDRVPVSLNSHHRLPTTFAGVTSFFGLRAIRAVDAGSRIILQLVIVRYMAARCTCSGSAAGFHLQVERPIRPDRKRPSHLL